MWGWRRRKEIEHERSHYSQRYDNLVKKKQLTLGACSACTACARVTVVSLSVGRSVCYQASCNMRHLHVEIGAL